MRTIFGVTVALAAFATCISSAEAINVSRASVVSGVAVVRGGKAAPNAQITWEDIDVAKSNKNGLFNFSGIVPSDCIGRLSDGTSTIEVPLTHCTPTPEPTTGVLRTGQTLCYDINELVISCAGTGHDGELLKGTARSYTVNGNGLTITDNVTGLEWEKLCNGTVIPECPTINDVATFYTWEQAFQKIADLNTARFAGHSDWRLPNVNELQTLADYGRVTSAINPVFDNGVDSFTQPSFYWSSTTYEFNPSSAWQVLFFDGRVSPIEKTNFALFVRAVRGGS
jgi:hypothetical protein